MRTKLILGVAGVVIAGVAFVAGVLVERDFPWLFASEPNPPVLISPADGGILSNRDYTKGLSFCWEFTWSEVPRAQGYPPIDKLEVRL